jgi:hypothetical protein
MIDKRLRHDEEIKCDTDSGGGDDPVAVKHRQLAKIMSE